MNRQLAKDSQCCSDCPSTYGTDPAAAVAGSVITCRHCAGTCLELYIRGSLNWPTDLLQDGGLHLSQHASTTGPNRDPQYQVSILQWAFAHPGLMHVFSLNAPHCASVHKQPAIDVACLDHQACLVVGLWAQSWSAPWEEQLKALQKVQQSICKRHRSDRRSCNKQRHKLSKQTPS